ncbi:MAG: hypothetical protein D3904_07200 [Candidatus Electrothrix sp. EH2]|nr:hypothetical protein [Candidatus Electrothrix sp. EH2]
MSFLPVLFFAFALDLLLGDPRRFPHPVRLIGHVALLAESLTRKLPLTACNSGRLAVFIVLSTTAGTCLALLLLLSLISQPVFTKATGP